ncbi:MAG: protein kinase [Verrucomicrobiae bacterium]|nr:protein kinase [Verrucomicrobiae bacterium]
MTIPASCPDCGCPLRASVLEGLCPKCLARHCLRLPRVVAIADSPIAHRLAPPSPKADNRLWIGDYEVEAEIARGGMGVVYRARQVKLGRTVALKLLLAGQFADPLQARRFRAEAEALARLDHPGIVPILEFGEFEGRQFFSMRLVEGPSLAAAMGRFALPATTDRLRRDGGTAGPALRRRQRELARFLAEIGGAVHHAHQRGILHRDLKPGNVLLDLQGRPQVTDFGLARILGEESGVTGTSLTFGTPAYMAPEQMVDPHNVTIAADLYSLGAIGYELLTGRPPFEAESAVDIAIQARSREPAPVRSLMPLVDRDLETIILKCLEKDPKARYDSASGLAEDLERFARGEPVAARPVSPWGRASRWARRRPGMAVMAGTLALAVLVAGLGGLTMSLRLSREIQDKDAAHAARRIELRSALLARAAAERLRGEAGHREQSLRGVLEAARIAKDADVLNEAIAQLAQMDIVPDRPRRQRPTDSSPIVCSPDFSIYYRALADGAVEARWMESDALRWRQDGLPAGNAGGLTVSPDSNFVALIRNRHLTLLRADDGAVLWDQPFVNLLGFHPGGSWLLAQAADRRVVRVESATGVPLAFPAGFRGMAHEFAHAPDGRSPVMVRLNADTVEFYDWDADCVLDRLKHQAMLGRLAWEGHRVAASDAAGNVVVWRLPSRKPLVLPQLFSGVSGLFFVPGSPFLMIVGSGSRQTSIWDTDSGERVIGEAWFTPEQVSRDGSQVLYFLSQEWGVARILPAVGRLRLHFPDAARPGVRRLRFSPDSRYLAVIKQAGVHLYDLARPREVVFVDHFGAVNCWFLPETNSMVLQGRNSLRRVTWQDSGAAAPTDVPHASHWEDGVWLEPGTLLEDQSTVVLPRSDIGLERVALGTGLVVGQVPNSDLRMASHVAASGPWTACWLLRGGAPAVVTSGGRLEWRGNLAGEGFLQFSPDGRWLLASSRGEHRVCEVPDWNFWRTSAAPDESHRRLVATAWMPDSRHLAAAEGRSRIAIRDVVRWTNIVALTSPRASEWTCMEFSAGGRWLAVGTARESVEVWDFADLSRALSQLGLTMPLTAFGTEAHLPSIPPQAAPVSTELPTPKPPDFSERDPRAGPDQVDLSAHYNAVLWKSWLLNDIELPDDSLALFPAGLFSHDGVTFDARGIVQLSGERFLNQAVRYPESTGNIPIGRQVSRIHLLGGASDAYPSVPRGTVVARVRLGYSNGSETSIPLRLGRELEDFNIPAHQPPRLDQATIAWWGLSQSTEASFPAKRFVLYHMVLGNPFPDRQVQHLELISANGVVTPFFVAVTTEQEPSGGRHRSPDEPTDP